RFWPAAACGGLGLWRTAGISHRSWWPAYLCRFWWNTCAIAAAQPGRSRSSWHGAARFTRAPAWRAPAFGAALYFAESPGQFLPPVGRWISIRTAYGFPAGAARLRTSEAWPLNPARLFPTMDTASWRRLQIPKLKSQAKDQTLTLKWKMALNDVILKNEHLNSR